MIDGYTRSASTFAVYALQLAQPVPVRLAHHLHAPAQLVAAARAQVPALAVIREPQGAILSQLIREPDVALRDALIAYARFYERLFSYRDRLVVADFEEVTKDFGAVTRRVNERFGTAFAEFEPSEQNVRRCFELIKLRGTLSPVLLGFESGTVTADELLPEVAALARRSGPAAEAWIPSADTRPVQGRAAGAVGAAGPGPAPGTGPVGLRDVPVAWVAGGPEAPGRPAPGGGPPGLRSRRHPATGRRRCRVTYWIRQRRRRR